MMTSYFGKSGNTPGAISISLYPPKWWSSHTYPPLAPTRDMLRISDFDEYRRMYWIRVLGNLDPDVVYEELVSMTAPYEPILLCFEKEKSGCHRSLVSYWLESCLEIRIKEIDEVFDPQVRLF